MSANGHHTYHESPAMQSNIMHQHYVWRHYLKPWMRKGRVWCLRNKKPFAVNVEKIAVEDYFYRAEPLTTNERLLIRSLIDGTHTTAHPLLNDIYTGYLNASFGTEQERNNAVENYQTLVERSAIPLLERLYASDVRFWSDNTDRANFCYFIGLQSTRTKKARRSTIEAFEPLKNHPENPGDIDPRRLANILALILADTIGNWLDSYAIPSIVQTDSETRFLTCDQPAYNMQGIKTDEPLTVEGFEFYYPFSPHKALVLKKEGLAETNVGADDFNKLIVSVAGEFVFARSREDLLKYCDDPDEQGQPATDG
jgi:hypothetical protein